MLKDLKYLATTLFRAWKEPSVPFISEYDSHAISQRGFNSFALASSEHYGDLYERHKDICKKAGLSSPLKLIICEGENPTASYLHTGSLLVTTGALKLFDNAEMDFILGHEITHHMHRKSNLFSLASSVILPILASGLLVKQAGKKELVNAKTNIGIIKTIGLFAIAHEAIKRTLIYPRRWIDRKLEHDADRGGVILTENLEAAKSQFITRDAYYAEKDKAAAAGETSIKAASPNEPSWREELLKRHPNDHDRVKYLEKIYQEKNLEDSQQRVSNYL